MVSLLRASLVAQRLKRLPAMWETCVQSLGQEDPLKEEMAAHSSILVENPMDGGTWWATVQRVAKSRTQLSDFTSLIPPKRGSDSKSYLLSFFGTWPFNQTPYFPDPHTARWSYVEFSPILCELESCMPLSSCFLKRNCLSLNSLPPF